MKAIIASVVWALIFLLFTGCSDTNNNDNPCGIDTKWTGNLKYNFGFSETQSGFKRIVYEDTNTPEDICTEKHVTATFLVRPTNNISTANILEIVGKAYWGGFYEKETELAYQQSNNTWYGTISNFGLKDAFPNETGWIGLQVIFNTTPEMDENYINNAIQSMEVEFFYTQEPL
ncbi:hypothetical protein C7N43_28380 [Sphingobacteriales bacterium UPWRP_1]|nr:hypothetical protein BVG80_18275 [Sphingobacteriales bacterium TSM_CSM]PSJ73590.1 hypothetical protein C7N43_28380 [Sphingobacteriales bacterium UPWRP_1]